MEGFSDGSSTLPASTKKKDMTMCHVFLFGFRPPEAASSLRYFKCSGQMNCPCAKVFTYGENACTAQTRRRPNGR